MTTIYIREQGTQLGRRGERLVVSQKGQVIDHFPLVNIDQVVLMGNVQLTSQATATLLAREIDVVFLSSYGKYRGRLEGEGSKQVVLRQNQLVLLSEAESALELARPMINGKIHNQRVILQRQLQRILQGGQELVGVTRRPDTRLYEQSLAGMAEMQRGVERSRDVDTLRGFEGKAAVYYFQALRALLDPDWGFEQRAYYPPPDPFNALLSFLYSLLLKDVRAGVQLVGLDPFLGCFHAIAHGRPSLALDLMEEWRPIVADSLALSLVNRGEIGPDDFVWTGRGKRPVALSDPARQLVLEAYGERQVARIGHRLARGQTTVQRAIVLQSRQFARVMNGDEADYEPLMVR